MPILNYYKPINYVHPDRYVLYNNMPNSRKRHHSRSRSRSRSNSRDRKDCDYKRKRYDDESKRKVDSQKSSLSSVPECQTDTTILENEKDFIEDSKHQNEEKKDYDTAKNISIENKNDAKAEVECKQQTNDEDPIDEEVSENEAKMQVEKIKEENACSGEKSIDIESADKEDKPKIKEKELIVILDNTYEEITTPNTSATQQQLEQTPKKGSGLKKKIESEKKLKSDMKLPLPRRDSLTEKEKENLDFYLENQEAEVSYLKDLKSGKPIRKSFKTWPYEEPVDEDVTIVDMGETICEDKSTLSKFRAKFFKFQENRRPPYYGTWKKKSVLVTPRRPFTEDTKYLNYEEDSDDDWEEEEQGESLNGSEDEADKENEDEKDDYEVDNDFFVPHGHLSEDEIDDEENASLSPESLKQKLKLLKEEFDQDMQLKTNKLKPRSIGCIWYNKDGSNVEEALNRYLQPLAIISNGPIIIKKRSEITAAPKYRKVKSSKELNSEHIPVFLKIIHGNTNKKILLVEQFLSNMHKSGITVDTSKATLIKKLKQFAKWRKCDDDGPMKNKFGWFVHQDVKLKYEVDLS
ncbi:hypothetical protein JTB14_009110 [Gonioctena quinquepunctata]|nr:hypothetical protein JTB14_009110 [Gonioctena quinquepunctata]